VAAVAEELNDRLKLENALDPTQKGGLIIRRLRRCFWQEEMKQKLTEEVKKQLVQNWQRVGPLLEEQREEDVRNSDTVSNVAAFGRLYAMALAASPPLPTSGLVEQQRFFAKLRST